MVQGEQLAFLFFECVVKHVNYMNNTCISNIVSICLVFFACIVPNYIYAASVSKNLDPNGAFDNISGTTYASDDVHIVGLQTAEMPTCPAVVSYPFFKNGGTWPKGVSDYGDGSQYIEFYYPPANIPNNATTTSVILTSNYFEDLDLDNAKLQIWNGSNYIDVPLLAPIHTTCLRGDSETIDIHSIVNTPAQLNGLKIRFLAYRSSAFPVITGKVKTETDYLDVAVSYTTPDPLPTATGQELTQLIGSAFPIILSGTSTMGNPLTYSIVSAPMFGTLSPSDLSGTSTVVYTPSATTTSGDDLFTFKVNDGQDSLPATILIHLLASTSTSSTSTDIDTTATSTDDATSTQSVIDATSTTENATTTVIQTVFTGGGGGVGGGTFAPMTPVIVSTSTAPVVLAGDINKDGVVNIFDLTNIFVHWGEKYVLGDFNTDGTVDIFDFNYVMTHWTLS